jgi:uncharacterized protein
LKLPEKAEALTLLRKVGCPQNVIDHCLSVAALAVEVAEACAKRGAAVNIQLVETGALLHDIGRSKTHGVEHGVIGGQMAVEMGLPNEIARIIERHVGAGITLEEAIRLGLPPRDYTPQTLEEKIVCYADKKIDDGKRVSLEETIKKFAEELGEDHPAIKRLKALNEEIIKLAGQDFY